MKISTERKNTTCEQARKRLTSNDRGVSLLFRVAGSQLSVFVAAERDDSSRVHQDGAVFSPHADVDDAMSVQTSHADRLQRSRDFALIEDLLQSHQKSLPIVQSQLIAIVAAASQNASGVRQEHGAVDPAKHVFDQNRLVDADLMGSRLVFLRPVTQPPFAADSPGEDFAFGSDDGDVLRSASESVHVHRKQRFYEFGLGNTIPISVSQTARRAVAASHHDSVIADESGEIRPAHAPDYGFPPQSFYGRRRNSVFQIPEP